MLTKMRPAKIEFHKYLITNGMLQALIRSTGNGFSTLDFKLQDCLCWRSAVPCSRHPNFQLERAYSVCGLEIQAFDLICRYDIDLRLTVANFDNPDDADGFPLDHGNPLIARNC
jgi:hypothetical protein